MSASSIIDFSVLGIRVLDVIDLVIVAILFYNIYKLLKGTIAFNIFVGVVLFYVIGKVVEYLEMELLRIVLGPFLVSGVLILIIIFQPEVRQFLLMLGNNTLKDRSKYFEKFGFNNPSVIPKEKKYDPEILNSIDYLSKNKTGALLVFSDNPSLSYWNNSGIKVDARLSGRLLLSIFQKKSPMHDGAVIVVDDRIYSAEVVLPLSERTDLPPNSGLRHRAAIGISEKTNAIALIVSEENGRISVAKNGELTILNSANNINDYFRKQLD